jgi:hypothetical protein
MRIHRSSWGNPGGCGAALGRRARTNRVRLALTSAGTVSTRAGSGTDLIVAKADLRARRARGVEVGAYSHLFPHLRVRAAPRIDGIRQRSAAQRTQSRRHARTHAHTHARTLRRPQRTATELRTLRRRTRRRTRRRRAANAPRTRRRRPSYKYTAYPRGPKDTHAMRPKRSWPSLAPAAPLFGRVRAAPSTGANAPVDERRRPRPVRVAHRAQPRLRPRPAGGIGADSRYWRTHLAR